MQSDEPPETDPNVRVPGLPGMTGSGRSGSGWLSTGQTDQIFSDETHRHKVVSEQVRLAARSLVSGTLFHLALVIVLYFALSFQHQAPGVQMWIAILLGAVALRSLGCFLYLAKSSRRLWVGRVILIGTGALVGCIWGAMPWLFFQTASAEYQILVFLFWASCLWRPLYFPAIIRRPFTPSSARLWGRPFFMLWLKAAIPRRAWLWSLR